MKIRYMFLIAVLFSMVGLSAFSSSVINVNRPREARDRLELDLTCNTTGFDVSGEMIRMLYLEDKYYEMAKSYTIHHNDMRMKLIREIKFYERKINGPFSMVDDPAKMVYQRNITRAQMLLQENWKTYNLKMLSLMNPDQARRWDAIVGNFCGV